MVVSLIMPDRRWLPRISRTLGTALFRLYEALDRRVFSKGQIDALALVDTGDLQLASALKKIFLGNDSKGARARDEQIRALGDYKPDVILNFSELLPDTTFAAYADYGSWSMCYGSHETGRPGASLFWEIYRGEPVSQTHLRITRTDPEFQQEIYSSLSGTCTYSLFRNRNETYWKSSAIIIRCLQELSRHGWNSLISNAGRTATGITPGEDGQPYPTNSQMAIFIPRVLSRIYREHYERRRCSGQWLIGYRMRQPGAENPASSLQSGDFALIVPPPDRLYADPFVVKHEGVNFIFFEECEFDRGKGFISYVTLEAGGGYSSPATALERDYHLSYPMIFQWQGIWYMIPETKENRTIELYRAVRFPDDWQLENVLFTDVSAVDTTLTHNDGKWWLFANMSESGGSMMDELFLFYAESPVGDWQPHARNSIVSDVRKARPAGGLFRVGDDLIRPSQDNSVRYGYAINLNRIDALSEGKYRETTIGRIEPTWLPSIRATHTFNSNEDVVVLDGLRLLSRKQRLPSK